MTYPTVNVTVKMVRQDGTPCVGARVTALLDKADIYQGFVVSGLVSATTDDTGTAVLALFPNAPDPDGLGTTGSVYTVRASAAGTRPLEVTCQVPNTNCTLDAIADAEAQSGLTEAQAAEAAAQTYAATASGSATAAAGSATAAATSATNAATSATNAATSATTASSAATAASASQTAAGTSATNAAASEAAAASSAALAGTRATAAGTSATDSAASATAAAGSATAAAGSVTTAAGSATAAAGSATAAAGSATAAASSATAAAASATGANASATDAATQAGNAAASAGSATTSATNAANSATSAAASDASAASTLATAVKTNVTTVIVAGYTITPFNAGSKSAGTFTPASASGNYQYLSNDGAFTLAAPTADCGMSIQVTNGAAAGAITFSGFTVGVNKGDELDTINGHQFRIRIERINGVATYSVQALQ